MNLDDQWKQIMQSMARSPKECAAMQEAVMRFAAQPAVFGIDPAVAERCAIARLRVRVVRVRSSLQGGAPLLLRVRVG